ncbi:hypothetical protein [Thermofilum pendens]|uniref:Uncharacterized protein n=1 Tax=Thermofilum pendens (strain DSM 2475 / Hrk 5) TaxID=368408 RepID=A1RYT2_THEPD|nr:hypothetical protein [Thermofilum pendens]ABL78362.1 hypothetical protein Tpen_0962 [Thermofilum pendens Hrk 5]
MKRKVGNAIVVKVLHHHGGVNTLLVSMARRAKVEVQRCGDTVDLDSILRERGLL